MQIIRLPIALFPSVLAVCSDAFVALGRINTFLTAEELGVPYVLDTDPQNRHAIRVNGSFTWEAVGDTDKKVEDVKGESQSPKDETKPTKKRKWWSKKQKGDILPAPTTSETVSQPLDESENENEKNLKEETPFSLTNISMKVLKGQFVAIVGRVGSGKSSLLQSLVGEMRRTEGEVNCLIVVPSII